MILPFFSGLTFLIFMIDNGFATHFYIVDNQCPNYLKDYSSAVSSCHKTFCEPYNEEELRRKPSVLYLRIYGRLGNKMLGYAFQLASKLEYGLRTVLDACVLSELQYFMKNTTFIEPLDNYCVLPESLPCDEDKKPCPFPPFEHYNGLVQTIGNSTFWKLGKWIFYVDGIRLLGTNLNGNIRWGELLSKHESAIRQSLQLKDRFFIRADRIVQKITEDHIRLLKQRGKKVPKKFIYIGVHVRRHDSTQRMIDLYNLWDLKPSYYLEAIHLYRRKFKSKAIFLVTSDTMPWVQQNILARIKDSDVYSAGTGRYLLHESVGTDMALMARCNHTVLSYGTFSFWSGFLAGGKRVMPHILDMNSEEIRLLMDGDKDTLPTFMFPDEGVRYNEMTNMNKK